jgi:hypothetical protein
MPFDLSQMSQLLDPVWEATIQETDEFSASFWNRLQSLPEEDSNAVGRKIKVRTGYNESESYAPFSSTSGYAQGGNSTFTTFLVPYRTVSTQGEIDQEAIDNDDGSAYYHPVVDEMAATIMAGFKKINRACLMGDGTGAIAVLTANYNGGTPTVLTTAPSATVFGNKGAQFVKVGKKIQVYNSTGTTLRNGTIGGEGILTVSSVVKSTGVITFTSNAPSDAVVGDIIVPERSASRGIHGLPYWVDDSGSIFGVSRTSNPGLKSVKVDGSSGSILVAVETMFSTMAHYIEEDVALSLNGQGMHEFFWSPTQREAYRKQALGLGMTMLGSEKIDTGYAHNEQINGYSFTVTKDHDNTKIHALKMSDWYRVTRGTGNNPFREVQIHGSKFYNKSDAQGRISGGLGFVLAGYCNIACRNVRNQAVIYNLPVAGYATGNV